MRFSKPLSVVMSAAMVAAFSPAASAFAEGEGKSSQPDQTAVQEGQAAEDVTAGCDLAGKDGSVGYYRVVDKGAKTAEFVLSKASGKTAEVPSKIMLSDNEEYSVVSVASKAFFGMQKLTGVTVGEGVKAIGDRAFEECVNLKSVELPQGLETIGDDAFFYCTRLMSAKLPAGLRSIGTGAFYGSGLTNVNIPEGVTTIERYTFARCESLKKVAGMAGVTSIAARAFQACLALKSVELHEGLTAIGDRGFDQCESLRDIALPQSLETIGEWSFNDCIALESVSLGVKDIPRCAFASDSSLQKVELRDGVESIGDSAFSSCEGWTDVKLPKTVNKIDPQAFNNFWLESFSVAEGSESYSSVNGVLYNADKTELVRYPEHKKGTSYKPVAGTVKVADYAFSNAQKLTSLDFGGVKEIGNGAVYNADSLKSVKFDNSLVSLGESSFYGTALKSVTLPASLKELPKEAFSSCSLKTVDLGSIEKIAMGAFSDDGALKSITIPATATDIAGDFATGAAVSKYKLAAGSKSFKLVDGVLYSADGKTLVSCPSTYRNAKKKYALKIADGCETIGEAALSSTSLTSVSIPASVTTIKARAFENLTSTVGKRGFKIPATVTTIEDGALGHDNNYGIEGVAPGVLVVGKRGSAAEKYALDNDFAFATSTPKMSIGKAKLAKKGKKTTVAVKGMKPGQVKFYSSNKRVVKVDASGKVTAVGAGKTNIVAAMGSYYLHVNVSVGGKKATVSKVDPYSGYKSVTSKKNLKAWEKKYYAANKGKSFSRASNPAIRCYTTNDYVAIKAMQGDEKYVDRAHDNYGDDIEEYGEVSTLLKWELGKFKLPVNTELFSGIGSVDAYTGTTTSLDDMQASVGKTLTHPVVISTSLFDDTAYGFASGATATVIHIYAPKNMTVGGYLYKFSAFPTEYELLLANDAQFKVVDCGVRYAKHHSAESYEGSGDKVYERYITLEYLGGSAE